MPHDVSTACVIALNDKETKHLFAGGITSNGYATNTYTYDWDAPTPEWQDAGVLPTRRNLLSCSRATLDVGDVVVVAGGWAFPGPTIYDDVDLYIIDTGTW